MKWDDFYEKAQALPVIETRALQLLFEEKGLELQLTRWVKQGRIIQLRRGYYILAQKYAKLNVFEPFVAAILKNPSYISLEKALEMHHLIPDVVFAITSVTSRRRPGEFVNSLGRFKYACIKKEYFWGYHVIEQQNQKGYLADPEKALLDLFYFQRKKITDSFIQSLRLQNTELLDFAKLDQYAQRLNIPFVKQAVVRLKNRLKEE